MKTLFQTIVTIIIFLFVFSSNNKINAQVVAGTTPIGGYLVNPNFNFSVVNISDDTTGTLDLNCDNVPDMEVQIIRGATAIDGANLIYLYVFNPSYSVITNANSASIKDVQYFYPGDTLIPSGSFSWSNDTLYSLGNYGCLSCLGPWMVGNMYVAFNDGLNVGWLKISFDIADQGGPGPITFTMNEVLTYCLPNSIGENQVSKKFVLSPNPTNNDKVRVQFDGKISEIELFNSIGKRISYKQNSADNEIQLPSEKGIYLVRIVDSNGKVYSDYLIRN